MRIHFTSSSILLLIRDAHCFFSVPFYNITSKFNAVLIFIAIVFYVFDRVNIIVIDYVGEKKKKAKISAIHYVRSALHTFVVKCFTFHK